jgi:hypothetical protein
LDEAFASYKNVRKAFKAAWIRLDRLNSVGDKAKWVRA